MAIEFTNLVGDWRRIVEDYVTDPANAADAPGVEGTITVTPILGEGRHAPRGVPSGGVFYTFAPLDLRVYRGILMDQNMNSDITVAIEVDGYPIAWRAKFDLQYRRIKIPLQDVIFGPNEVLGGQVNLSSLVARDGLPPEYEGSYVQLMDAVRAAADHADRAELAADSIGDAAVVVVEHIDEILAAPGFAADAEMWATSFGLTATATTGAPGSSAAATVAGTGPEYGLTLTVPRGDKGEQGAQGAKGATGDTGPKGDKGDTGTKGDTGAKGDKGDRGDDGEVSQAALDAAVATLVDNAPEALNTLSELATSLGNDPNFATTVSTEIGLRAKTADVNTALAGKADAGAETTATWAGVSGKPSTFTPATHTHAKSEVGLGNVDNTSDAAKPVSTATQAAINAKIQLVSSFPASPVAGVLYLKAE